MMIKIILLTHFWAIAVAILAWLLQSDRGNTIGKNFPNTKIWLALILLCFLPALLYAILANAAIKVSSLEVFNMAVVVSNAEAIAAFPPLNYKLIYIIFASLFMVRTLWQWGKLQGVKLTPTSIPNVYDTIANIPPLTLSWPRRAIVIPANIDKGVALINHERAHLKYHDAEMTLGLLLLRDLMLHNPAISFLVNQWRLAIELRADRAATQMLSATDKHLYAELLLQGLNPNGDHADGRALPCPTAHLTSTRHRSVKMRLTEIMENNTSPRKYRWYSALAVMAVGATTLGIASTDVQAKPITQNADSSQVEFKKRVPPMMPVSCKGLDTGTIRIEGKKINIKGKSTYMHTAIVGEVKLKYDIRANGTTENIRITSSNHPCFDNNAKASVAQWVASPESSNIKDATVMLRFMLTGEEHEDIEGPLNKFLY